MEDSMKDYAMKFFLETGLQVFRVFPDPVNANIYFGYQGFVGTGKRETQDISKIIVL